jgi:hypothetical protein
MYTSMFRKAMLGDTAKLSLDFTTGTVPTAVTFTRADSTARATYIDASGYVKTVASAGDARFDYVGGVAKGLLIEAGATNLFSQSNDWTVSPWSKPAEITWDGSTTATAPDGVSAAKQITVTSGSSASVAQSVASGTDRSLSVWIKAGSLNSFSIGIFNPADAWGTGGTNTASIISGPGSIAQQVGSLWIVTGLSTSQWTRVQLFRSVASTTLLAYPGQSSGSITGTAYLWGAQIESGTQASSLIQTTTASLTRLADDAVIRSTAWSSLYAQPGAMVVEFYRGAYGAGSRSVLATDTTAARHWDLLHANGSATSQIAFSSGSAVTQTGLVSGLNKVALAWNAPSPTASFDLCVNGATPTFGGSNVGTTLSTWLTLGSQSTTGVSGTPTWDNYLNNSIKSVKYYTGLTYAEMQAKTT